MIGINNPLNIRYNGFNKWKGLIGQTKGFCNFETLDYGIRAACILVARTYLRNGYLSVRAIIEHFAPSFENNTEEYISFVCKGVGISPDDIITSHRSPYVLYSHILSFMSRFEGNPIDVFSFKKCFIDNRNDFHYLFSYSL